MLPPELQFRFDDVFDKKGVARPGAGPRFEGHVHTDHSDGYDTTRDCVEFALSKGIETIVFAEHMRRGAPWRDAYFEEVECLACEFRKKIRIVCGIEVSVLDRHGTLDTDPESLERAELIIGSVHRVSLGPNENSEAIYHVPDATETLEHERSLLKALCENGHIDVIGHPFGTYYEKFGSPPENEVHAFLRLASETGKAVELNVRHMDVLWLAACASGAGEDFLIWPASDAHIARHVGRAADVLFFSE